MTKRSRPVAMPIDRFTKNQPAPRALTPAEQARENQAFELVCTKMGNAGRKWLLLHPGCTLRFNGLPKHVIDQAPAGTPDDKIAMIAHLGDCLDWWPANDETRSYLTALFDASDRSCTYLMAQAVTEMLFREWSGAIGGHA